MSDDTFSPLAVMLEETNDVTVEQVMQAIDGIKKTHGDVCIVIMHLISEMVRKTDPRMRPIVAAAMMEMAAMAISTGASPDLAALEEIGDPQDAVPPGATIQ